VPPQERQTRVAVRRAQSWGGVVPPSASAYQEPVRKDAVADVLRHDRLYWNRRVFQIIDS
jgi:hypothetical protein